MVHVPNEVAIEYQILKECLLEIGYPKDLIRNNYSYTDLMADSPIKRSLLMAAFGQYPPSYATACLGVTLSSNDTAAGVYFCRSLGAPQIFDLRPGFVGRWAVLPKGSPRHIEDIPTQQLHQAFLARKNEWCPEVVLRAKSALPSPVARQLDFVDLGLLPALEQEAQVKLKQLIDDLVRKATSLCEAIHPKAPISDETLFQVIFRLIAGRVLIDTKAIQEIDFSHPDDVLKAVGNYYGHNHSEAIKGSSFTEPRILEAISERIAESSIFSNLSTDTIAYTYENSLVTDATRRRLSIHSTPPYIANYILNRLPIEEIPCDERKVLDPTCGRGTFLVAAMRRLRDLLSADMSPKKRHSYFVSHIKGMEIDIFAREAAFFSLLYADLPNPDGWNILLTDAYGPGKLETEASNTKILITNPPFEDFTPDERIELRLQGVEPELPSKGGELLRRVLPALPEGALLGVVMPRALLDGRSYTVVRNELAEHFDLLEIVSLPDKIFTKSDAETSLLMARKRTAKKFSHNKVIFRQVREFDRSNFKRNYTATNEFAIAQANFPKSVPGNMPLFWVPYLYTLWDSLNEFPRFGDFLEIHRGVEYETGIISERKQSVIKSTPFKSGVPGVTCVGKQLAPFILGKPSYLETDSRFHRRNAWSLQWDKPKIIANAAPNSRGPWRISAAVDRQGLLCTEVFYAMWLKDGDVAFPLELFAAVLNGPIANAFIYEREGKRRNRKQTIEQIPFPNDWGSVSSQVIKLVHKYVILSLNSEHQSAQQVLMQIDAAVLRAYALSPHDERRLLDLFWQRNRPGCPEFSGYIPPDFSAWIPLHIYLSPDFAKSTAKEIMEHGPQITEPDIIKFLEEI